MAQIKNNQVKFGLNLNPSSPSPSFNTRTSTQPVLSGNRRKTAAEMYGPSSLIPTNRGVGAGASGGGGGSFGGSSTGIAFPAYGALGIKPNLTNTTSPNISPSTPQTGQTFAPTTNSTTNQLESIKSQALGIQDLLNQRKAAETKQTNQNKQGTQEFFPGVLQSLLGASKPTKEQERVRRLMEETALQNKAIADQAKAYSEQYGKEIARVGQLGAGAVAGNLSTGTNVVGSGNAAIASQSASARMDALAKAQQAALEGTGQQLTAQEQTAQALRPSLEATLTQQAQQLSGLGTAGGLGAPLQVPYTSGLYAPFEAQQIAGQFGGWSDVTTAQQAQDLIAQYPDAGVVYDPNLSPQQNAQKIQQALQGSPSYQRGTFGAAGAGSYIGGQQLGAAGALTGQVAQLQSQGAAADANFNLMLNILQKGNINDLNVPILNQLTQNINRGLASDADVVAFRSALQTVRSQYAAILGGGTPTNETLAMASEKIPDTVSAAALQQVEQTMKAMVNNTVAAYNQTIGSYSGGASGGGGGDWSW